MEYLKFVRGIGSGQRRGHATIKANLQRQIDVLGAEMTFLKEGHTKSKDIYENKRVQLNVSEESVFALAWELEGYVKLQEMNGTLADTAQEILLMLVRAPTERGNVPECT